MPSPLPTARTCPGPPRSARTGPFPCPSRSRRSSVTRSSAPWRPRSRARPRRASGEAPGDPRGRGGRARSRRVWRHRVLCPVRPVLGGPAAPREVPHGVDDPHVRGGLREVPEEPPADRVVLLRQEPHVATQAEQTLEEAPGLPLATLEGEVVLGLEDQRPLAVAAAAGRGRDGGTEGPSPVLRRAEQGGEARARIEAGEAEPVDRAIPRDERRGLAVSDEGAVLDARRHRVRPGSVYRALRPTHRAGSPPAGPGLVLAGR